ncbi:ATP synthase F0 subunit A [Candidatus Kaiserbacteria bacterium RIFOXYB1_FULL_46_14]|uniref:ATP synthase subunit a n=1 Tax=Candidatus Kaiserbacteria bacterium RIFOXYB1_FULL_46_14 TaxID=1798531 RepID=A0A1F6FJY9_9BACT|nr:MAG: ATP synthase F0 subunit A [Candidatus Kaiserbacteria bacterium RIFOXYB1_FULL_46_14]
MTLIPTAYAASEGLSIHLAPEVLTTVGGLPITSTLLTVWLTMVVLLIASFFGTRRLKLVPGGFQNALELLIGSVYDYIKDVLESEKLAKRFFPLIMTIFLFILAMNWMGLLPGVDSIGIYSEVESHGEAASKLVPFFHPPATDLNITIAFALVAFVAIELAGVTLLGVWKYGGKFINFHSPLAFVIGLIELLSEMARLISFSFRLFGNIFAGKTLLMVVMFLATPYVLPVPLIAYELFVGFIQAFIFAILTLYFIKIAIEEPH